jgi:hypothetical protein
VADHFEGSRAKRVGMHTSRDREAISHEHDKAVHVVQSLGSAFACQTGSHYDQTWLTIFEESRAMHVGMHTSRDREAISHDHDKAVHFGIGQVQRLGSASV